ncbi:MAG: MBL fold metallo-hydrolase [Victivallales bacterium]|jgi:L-ascorbate 6-phosphate lactonase
MKNKNNISSAIVTGGVSLKYLGQAGFLLVNRAGRRIVIDPYLSDCVERCVGFKRMQPPVAAPESLCADIVLSTHSHLDHLDIDSFPALISRPNAFFIGAPDCEEVYKSLGIPKARYKILRAGESTVTAGVTFRAIYADHGDLAPDAVGFLMEIDGVKIYNVGDSGLATDKILKSLGDVKVDIMIVPVNGAFGNLDALEACALGVAVRPVMIIGSHFWMFVEQGGDPAAFLAESKRLGLNGVIMSPGEVITLGNL